MHAHDPSHATAGNMERLNDMIQKLTADSTKIDRHMVERILIVYEEPEFFIGDSCIMFDKFKACKQYFANAGVDINFNVRVYADAYSALLKANPYIDGIFDLDWKDIDYNRYDLVFCVTAQEDVLLEIVCRKHESEIEDGTFHAAFFSFSKQLLTDPEADRLVFPSYPAFFAYCSGDLGPMELYIDEEERAWADAWLGEKGLKKNEKLLVILDSTTVKSKLLKMPVYYELLMKLLALPDIRILIFDEKNIGKEGFYRQLLGPEAAQKFIFSNGLELRKAIVLLGSVNVRLIFGPCTGLMHCASGIYNYFVRTGLDRHKVPLMITYTGKYHKKNENAYYWWNNAPLMNCMIIRQKNGQKEMVLLNNLTETEKSAVGNTLDCAEYTPGMILDFLNRHLKLDY